MSASAASHSATRQPTGSMHDSLDDAARSDSPPPTCAAHLWIGPCLGMEQGVWRDQSSAAAIASRGATRPVNCSTWLYAWFSNITKPPTTRPPPADTASASGVGHGL